MKTDTEDKRKSKDEILLDRCRYAKTLEDQNRCFEELAVFLETIGVRSQTDEIGSSHTISFQGDVEYVQLLQTRENISRSVLTTWPYGHVSAFVDRILDACGAMVSISTCSTLLKEIASKDQNNRCGNEDDDSLPSRSIVQACWATIQRTLLTARPPHFLSSSSPKKNDGSDGREEKRREFKRFISTIVLLLPQKLANACHATKLKIPMHGTPTYFYPRLFYFVWMEVQPEIGRKLQKQVNESDDENYCNRDGSLSMSALYAKLLIIQLLQTRRSEHVAKGLMQGFAHYSSKKFTDENFVIEHGSDNWNDHEASVISSFLISLQLGSRDTAALILALLQFSNTITSVQNTEWTARAICNSLFHSSSVEHQETTVEKLVFFNKASSSGFRDHSSIREGSQEAFWEKDQRKWSRCVTEVIAPSNVSLNKIDDTSISSFSKHLTNVADRWSQLTFVHEVEDRQQHHVSLVLWNGLQRFEDFSSSLQDPGQRKLVAALVNGVSHRLGSMLFTVRQDGLRIAQQLAKGLGQNDTEFDELIQDDSDERDICDITTSEKKKVLAKAIDKGLLKQENNGFSNPDAEYDSDATDEVDDAANTKEQTENSTSSERANFDNYDNSEDDLSLEWNDEFPVYDIEDDEEDLLATPKPLRILEALDLLRTGDNHDYVFTRHEVALEALPELIENRPSDLTDVAVSLALELLRIENKFNIENFDGKRDRALRKLLIEEPFLVGQTLIDQLFEESGLTDKLAILNSIQSAAFDLSGNGALAEASFKPTSLKDTKLLDMKQEGGVPMLSMAEKRSRTFRKRSRYHQKAIKNEFSNIAPMWFYSLVAGFLKNKEEESLWMGSTGSILLAYFFRCLAVVVEFSGFQASQVLANDLLDLVWEFRTAEVQEVRLSALVAVSSSLVKLSNEKLMSLLIDEGNLVQTMHEMSLKDSDKECRKLCQTITLSIHEILKSEQ